MYNVQCEELFGTYEADRAVEGLTDQIAQDAESLPLVGATDQYRLGKTDSFGGLPRLRIVFQILDEHRVLLAAIKADDKEEFFEGF